MSKYGVPLATLTEKDAPGGGRMLTGRLGHAVVVGLPIGGEPGAPQRWRLLVVTPDNPACAAARDRAAARVVLAHQPTDRPA